MASPNSRHGPTRIRKVAGTGSASCAGGASERSRSTTAGRAILVSRRKRRHDEEVAAYESGGTRAVAHPLGVAISKHPDQVSIGGGAGGSRQGGPSRAWLRRAQPTRCDPCGDPQAVRCSGTTRPSGSKKSERRSPACCGWPRPRSTPTPLLPPKVGFRVGFRGPEGRRPDECLSQLAVPTMNFLSGISDSNPRPPAWEQVEGLLISDESPVSTGS